MKDILKGAVYAGIFAVPFVVLLVTGSMFFPYITGKNFVFRILVEIMLAAWLVLMLYDSRYRPRFSWIAIAGLGLLVVMFFANLFGEYAPKAFWSNFERMEGYVTLVHFYFYFLITGTMLTVQKHWNWFFNTTISIAVVVCFFAFAQLTGSTEPSLGGWRVDSTLGNSTYMAVYMLFHIFVAALMFVRTKSTGWRYVYGGLIALFVLMLFQTGTRGAALGLVGGGLLTALYVALFAKGYATVRKVAAGGLIALVLLVAGFIAIRGTAFVQNTPVLDRLASITLEEGSVRFMVWNMAWEGFKERPILGWGQGNFNYVFNKEYDPGLYRAEAWYDRVHNIVLDWLVAGGILGAFFYFSIIGAAVYYIVVRPFVIRMRGEDDEREFAVIERGLLLGLLGAYVFHNLFVFDNIVSYIFFAVILAFIHSRTAIEVVWMQNWSIDRAVIEKVAAPVTGVALITVVYFVNVPAMLAASDIIDAFRADAHEERMAEFRSALDRDSFGDQEIVEQLSEFMFRPGATEGLTQEEQNEFLIFAEEEMLAMIERKPNDARLHVFLAGLYRSMGQLENAAAQLARARELSPTKPDIIIEQGAVALAQNNFEAARDFFAKAYELAPEYDRSQIYYANALILTEEAGQLGDVLTEDTLLAYATNNVTHIVAQSVGTMDPWNTFFEGYIEEHPESTRARTAFALLHYQLDNEERATTILENAAEEIPAFASTAECYIENIEDGDEMRERCTGG